MTKPPKAMDTDLERDPYLQLLDEMHSLPSIQQLPIPMSSALGLQAVEENLWRSMVLKLGNLSRPSGSSKLDIVAEDKRETGKIDKISKLLA